ncbi:N-acetylmannosamine-6-phosphate 2-epimerase [Dermabacter hominis]|uniref:Putative N-acetylmannosamine-6-phosphate 2-epimerase n=1 Tax=Dermabacter hominis 1368 TaxID=1450519 RepID=A0ABR4SKU9_9MICO|nr:N-acetylmannosamine-6-phosphate 2-epimerase [Dermabacter hominis]KDS93814.1 N-acetylmannosamine-6-phosphate 2-epimerase [Dermabacter hominis 1368]MDU6927492.1 N-acetylmannosamine-6-phosphate 2-epimerase [Dermabacter sp.]MCT1808203.1 N-acetylmannosamine-6-phosphate 2-epimerase [Dermabacter hominis]MDK8803828.1 N-acetylmannosamine-6-phosphate 2-epimerase [Dermabacter hominis]WIK61809.1 N-acetylmannosamine-6-phosphate 2-epimerase [Dermabacter hominis]
MHPVVAALEGTLIVSCQAYPGEPMRDPNTMARIAAAVEHGGASAVRAQGLDDIRHVKNALTTIPVIGIWKDGTDGVFITPTLQHCEAVINAGADILAVDGTRRPRPDGLTFAETVRRIRDITDIPVMADCDDETSALIAAEAGADIIGTTLAGYTGAREKTPGPDLDLLAALVEKLPGTAVVAEGRVHTTQHAAACRGAGAFAVVVGTAITHPTSITRWFHDAVTTTSPNGASA